MQKRVLVILGHPSARSFCGAMSEQYAQAARTAGHEVRVMALGDLVFDPVLHEGYNQVQALEADLKAAQAQLLWAQHVVLVFPIWWGGIPALLKGFIDRVFLPGFAFKYRPGSPFPAKLLKGRSADLLVSMDTPPWYYRWVYAMPGLHQMRRTTLAFCGIKARKTLTFGPMLGATPARRDAWLRKVRALAMR